MAKRVLYVKMELETFTHDHDAFWFDEAGLSWAATWIDSGLSNPNTQVESTVYNDLDDMVLDREEGIL